MRSRWTVSVVMLAALALGAPAAHAADAAVLSLQTAKPALEALPAGGAKADLQVTNLTTGDLALAVTSTAPTATAECTVQFDSGTALVLPKAAQHAVTVTYAPGCKLPKNGASFQLTAAGQALPVKATAPPKPEAKPDWIALAAFPAALGVWLVVLVIGLVVNGNMTFGTALPQLPTTWSFSDSWATNVTTAGGALTLVFGSSDVVKAFLGDGADSAIALATVGAAIAAAFAVLGGLVVHALKRPGEDAFTAGGFLTGAAVTLAGAFGELYVVTTTGTTLSTGAVVDVLVVAAGGIVGLVLAIYAATSIIGTLSLGTEDPAPHALSESTIAALVLASKCCADAGEPDDVLKEIKALVWPKVKTAKAGGKLVQKGSKTGTVLGLFRLAAERPAPAGEPREPPEVVLAGPEPAAQPAAPTELWARRRRAALL